MTDKPLDIDSFPCILRNPSDFRSADGSYDVIFNVQMTKVDYIQPMQKKALKPFAVFCVPMGTLEQAENFIKSQQESHSGLAGLEAPNAECGTRSAEFNLATLEQIAVALAVDPRTVQNYADAGLIVRNVKGQYDLLASLSAMNKARKDAETAQGDALRNEKLMGARLKRQERELDYHERAGNLVSTAAVMSVIEKAKAAEKQQVLFMPKQLAPRLEGDPAVNEAVLEEWAYAFLKGQTEINITADVAPAPDVDKMPEMKKRSRAKPQRRKGKH